MSKRRERIGSRRHRCTFKQHDGTVDTHGNPTYTTTGDWDAVVSSWPCELLTARGMEKIRGREVTAETTHVLFGDFAAAQSVAADMQAVVTNTTTGVTTTYEVVSVLDIEGDGREIRVELKREV